MSQWRTTHRAYFKASLILIVSILGMLYVLFSYYQTTQNIRSHNQSLLLQEQKEVAEAFHHFQQFLSLTESRLLPSLNKPEAIPAILAGKIEQLVGKSFPEIMSLAFIPAADPSSKYTRLGKNVLTKDKPSTESPGITYLGSGTFKLIKTLYDEDKKTFGTLQSTFSLASLLYNNFSKGEIDIIQDKEKPLDKEYSSVKIPDLPYTFVLKREPPSFGQFLWGFKLQLFSALIFGMILFFIGISKGTAFNRKKLIKQNATYKKLEETLASVEKEKQALEVHMIVLENLVKLKEQSKEGVRLLFNMVQERYRQMAAQVQAINNLTSKLISEEAGNDKLLQEIHHVSQEGTLVLRQLVSGFPMHDVPEQLSILESLEKIKAIFLPELTARSIKFEIKGKLKAPFLLDKLILEIVLHNIFYIIIDRLNKNNILKIELKESNSLQLTFFDDGYDVGDRIHKVSPRLAPESILCLSRHELMEFVAHLGWTISFQKEKGFQNSIRLLIPRVLESQELPKNVVNFFDFKSYGQ